jgi:hypothetical protein
MFKFGKRAEVLASVRFCDECAEVTSQAQRARRRYEATREQAQSWIFTR